MKIAHFQVEYLSHVCFTFTSPAGAVVVTDPFFAEGFEWQGHFERYLTPPDVAPEEISPCDVVFVSHIHGDHFDPDAVERIVGNTAAVVLAPDDVIDVLAGRGRIPAERLIAAGEGDARVVQDMTLTTVAGYDGSLDEQGRTNKFSLRLEADAGTIFYSGDCHYPPPAMVGRHVDAVFAWAHPDEERLAGFLAAIPSDAYVIMHCDRFEPGAFYCNTDPETEKQRVLSHDPNRNVIVPQRIRKNSNR